MTFAVNGGPGASSAYLHLLAIGPWRLPLGGSEDQPVGTAGAACRMRRPGSISPISCSSIRPAPAIAASSAAIRCASAFIRSKATSTGSAAFIMRWLKEKNRLTSPKFFAGESYGGFRGPLLAQKLQSDQGIGFSGLVLVSPVLDFDWLEQSASRHGSMRRACLPWRQRRSPVASRSRAKRCRTRRITLPASISSISCAGSSGQGGGRSRQRGGAAELTGLDPALTQRLAGRIDTRTFQRKFAGASREVVSAYDTDVASADPNPTFPVVPLRGSGSRRDDGAADERDDRPPQPDPELQAGRPLQAAQRLRSAADGDGAAGATRRRTSRSCVRFCPSTARCGCSSPMASPIW